MILRKLTGLPGDPFYPYNKDDGWRPRFKLINLENIGAERAKKQAIHISLEEMESKKTNLDDDNGQSEYDPDSEDRKFRTRTGPNPRMAGQ